MRITQGTFSYLPDLTDEQIEAQLALRAAPRLGDHGRAHRRPAPAQRAVGDVGAAAVRPHRGRRRRRHERDPRGARGVPARLREGRLLRPLARAPDHGAGLHRRAPAGRARASASERQEKADRQDPLHDPRLRDRRALRAPLRRVAARRRGNGGGARRDAWPWPTPPVARRHRGACSRSSIADLVALAPVKTRIREIAALLVIDRLRREAGPGLRAPLAAHELHRQPRHGQDDRRAAHGRDPAPAGLHREAQGGRRSRATTSSASTSATPRRRPGRCSSAPAAACCSSTRPTTCYRPENERDYGQEAIEILLQVMEAERERPRRRARRLPAIAWRPSSAPTPAWARASPTTSTSPTSTSTS